MSGMKDTLGDRPYATAYPQAPGFKEETTSKDAARAIRGKAATLRERVYLAILEASPEGITADEVAATLGETVLAVRPRLSELAKQQPPLIEPTGLRRANASGLKANVWSAACAG